jgi:hypothetical protein
MTIALESMAVTMPEVDGHPNRAAFRGVLTVVDVPSQKAPSGSKGHRVVLTKGAAEAALPSLLGMALDYAPSFDRHDVRRKVGVITSAEVVGRSLEVAGYLYGKDFPEIVQEIAKSGRQTESGRRATRAGTEAPAIGQAKFERWTEGTRLRASLAAAVDRIRSLAIRGEMRGSAALPDQRAGRGCAKSGDLGMSFEVTDVLLADARARVWTLTKVTFTGAAILRKDKAAYQDTWIELGE